MTSESVQETIAKALRDGNVCEVCGVCLEPQAPRCEDHVHSEPGDPEWDYEPVSAWSKEKPTVPGFYWYRMAMARGAFPVEVVYSLRTGDGKRLEACFTDGCVSYLDFMNGGEWQPAEPRP